jgi:uncharacterized membrane protein
MLLFLVGIGVLVYFILFSGKTSNVGLTTLGKESAEERLKTRFVNGEIDEKTYLQMKETIKG